MVHTLKMGWVGRAADPGQRLVITVPLVDEAHPTYFSSPSGVVPPHPCCWIGTAANI